MPSPFLSYNNLIAEKKKETLSTATEVPSMNISGSKEAYTDAQGPRLHLKCRNSARSFGVLGVSTVCWR